MPDECWQPADFLPDFADPDFTDKIHVLQRSIANIPDSVLISLVGNMITEEALAKICNLIAGEEALHEKAYNNL